MVEGLSAERIKKEFTYAGLVAKIDAKKSEELGNIKYGCKLIVISAIAAYFFNFLIAGYATTTALSYVVLGSYKIAKLASIILLVLGAVGTPIAILGYYKLRKALTLLTAQESDNEKINASRNVLNVLGTYVLSDMFNSDAIDLGKKSIEWATINNNVLVFFNSIKWFTVLKPVVAAQALANAQVVEA